MASITRKLQVNEKLYEFLLERATTSIAKSGIIPQTKIIEKARTIGLLDTKNQTLLIFAALGFFIALLISILFAYFLKKFAVLMNYLI